MTSARSTLFRAMRVAAVVIGLTTALLAGAYLWTFTRGISFLPLTLCLHADDVACSSDYFLGRDRAAHTAQLLALIVGFAGLALVAASRLRSRHLRSTARV